MTLRELIEALTTDNDGNKIEGHGLDIPVKFYTGPSCPGLDLLSIYPIVSENNGMHLALDIEDE